MPNVAFRILKETLCFKDLKIADPENWVVVNSNSGMSLNFWNHCWHIFEYFLKWRRAFASNLRHCLANFHNRWPAIILYNFICPKNRNKAFFTYFYQEEWVFISYFKIFEGAHITEKGFLIKKISWLWPELSYFPAKFCTRKKKVILKSSK